MPSGYSKQDAAAQDAGNYGTRFSVHQPARGVSSTGAVIRNPPGTGQAANQANVQPPDPLWIDYGSVKPYGGAARADADRDVSQLYFTVECRWGRSKPYQAGQVLFVFGTGESFQVESVENLEAAFKKVKMTCRAVS
jgi:hypothetical protein